MPNKRKKLIILDGNSLLHRSWHAIPPLTTKDGTVVNAAYGFAMAVDKIIRDHHPEYMAVAWDLPGKTFRHKAVESYKATREKKPQELYDQIPICQEILNGFGIPSLSVEGFEADDVIGTISNMEDQQGFDTMIVTGDLDALQLVDDNTHVLTFVKGLSETKRYDPVAVIERYGFGPEKMIPFKAMKGDASDNISGVPGVGDKTAAGLLVHYGSLDEMFADFKKDDGNWKTFGVKEKLRDKLLAHEEVARESEMLVTIVCDVKLPFKISDAELPPPNKEELLDLYRSLEFHTLIRRMDGDVAPPPFEGEKVEGGETKKVGTKKAKIKVLKSLDEISNGSILSIFALTQAQDLFGATLAGVCLNDGKNTALVVNPKKKVIDQVLSLLSSAEMIIAHDYKALLHNLGVDPGALPKVPVFDTMLASYILQSGSRAYDFPTVASEVLSESFGELPENLLAEKDQLLFAKATAALSEIASILRKQMKDENAKNIFEEIEIPLASALYRMECAGIMLDAKFLGELSSVFEKEISRLTGEIHKLAGEDFNVNSPSQLAVVLFEKLKLQTKGIKKTKTGYSTAASELEKLQDAHEIIPLVSEYREIAKLKSTYVDALPVLMKSDGRVHTDFNQAVAATGRLSSSNPNLQNIPIRTDLGRQIRNAFIAPTGRVLVAADYSQIELRLAAVIAKDKAFINAFTEGADIHTATAAMMFGVKDDEVSKEQRRAAKAINFGVLYGMGPHSLAKGAGVSYADAKQYIAKYFEVHHELADYIAATKVKVRQEGYVETLLGRRRYLPIESGIPMMIAAAERMAVNMPIQGTAADIMKMALLEAEKMIDDKYDGKALMLLQVHDELVFEVDKDIVEEFDRDVKQVMEGVASYEVPLAVEVGHGDNWGEIK
ncbi:MAG: DNA polymerase I [bacterium]|nr:DNA polymerase I [bacterium]